MNQRHLIAPAPGCMDVAEAFQARKKPAPFIDPIAYTAGERGLAFLQLMVNMGCPLPHHPAISHEIGMWLSGLLHGESATIRTIICPDYSWEPNPENPNVPFRYTFAELWDGVGLTAQRARKRLPEIWRFLQQCGVTAHQIRFVVSIADSEGESEALLQQLGISQEEFMARCSRSSAALVEAFAQEAPDIPVTCTSLLTEASGQWTACRSQAQQIVDAGRHFGRLQMPGDPAWQQGLWTRTLRMRENIYKRMRPGVPTDQALREQCVDYVGSGVLCARESRTFYFGVDNHVMAPFVQGGSPGRALPVMYMMANYT